MLRIAYVINSFEGGGAAAPVPAIIGVLAEAGAQVKLLALTLRNGKALPAIEAAAIDYSVRPGGNSDHFAALRWLLHELRDWRATHVWTSLSRATLIGQIAGARLRLPVVSWQHNAYLKPWNERLLRFNRNRSCLWIADSQQVAALTATRLRVPADRLVNWPIFFADPGAPRARGIAPGERLKIGSLGRLHPNKGYDILIDALALLKSGGFVAPVPFDVVIAGEGNDRAMLAARAGAAGIDNLAFPGFSADTRSFLAGLHLYVQPSRREGFCIAAHEAMQAGLPMIVSDVGEMPCTVRAGAAGLVVPPANPAALADALRHLLSAPGRLAAIGSAAHQLVLGRFPYSAFRITGQALVERLRQAQG